MTGFHRLLGAALISFFGVVPTSTNYTLKTYDFGNGGASSSSTNYQLNGTAGTQSGSTSNSTNYQALPGLPTRHANVPLTPTFTNPSNEYNRLRLVIDTASNPSDVLYNIAISSDNFVTTYYVQSDNSIGSNHDLTTYQNYNAWGGGSGMWILGLVPATTYQVKVRAYQGSFSESPFGPAASASTIGPSISFAVTTSLTSSPPFTVGFSGLTPGSVFSGTADAILTLSSNAQFGGAVYIYGLNSGLKSSTTSTTISSTTTDLSTAGNGYGAQVFSLSQALGGPMTSVSPYNVSGTNVGLINTSLQTIASTVAPVTTGVTTVRLKAKSDAITPAATDYTDTLTFIAAMVF